MAVFPSTTIEMPRNRSLTHDWGSCLNKFLSTTGVFVVVAPQQGVYYYYDGRGRVEQECRVDAPLIQRQTQQQITQQ